MEHPTNLETISPIQEISDQPIQDATNRNSFLILGALAVVCLIFLTIGLSIGKHQPSTEIETVTEPAIMVPQISPTASETENLLVGWKNYSLGAYTFKMPEMFIQQLTSTSNIATLFDSSSIKSLSVHMVLKGSGFGIECADKIQTRVVSALNKKVPIDVFQGIKPGKSEMCSFDSSDTFWFQANLAADDIIAMTFKDTDIDYEDAELLFDRIIATFQQAGSEDTSLNQKNWKTFSNAFLSLRYPPDINMTEKEASEIVLQKWGPTQKENTEFYDGISISIQPFEIPQTAEGYARVKIEEIEKNGIGEITKPLTPIQIGEYSGFTFSAKGLGEHQTIVLKSPSNMIIVMNNSTNDPGQLGFTQTVDQILSTLVLK